MQTPEGRQLILAAPSDSAGGPRERTPRDELSADLLDWLRRQLRADFYRRVDMVLAGIRFVDRWWDGLGTCRHRRGHCLALVAADRRRRNRYGRIFKAAGPKPILDTVWD